MVLTRVRIYVVLIILCLAFPANAGHYLPASSIIIKPVEYYNSQRSFVGKIEALRTSQLAFELTGKVLSVKVAEGDSVSLGQTLAELDTILLEKQLAQSRAEKKAVTAQYNFAVQTLKRRDKLKARGNIPIQDYDEAESQKDSLAARLESLEAKIDQLETQIDKAKLKAPYAGTISNRFVDEGAVVSPNQPILTLIETDKWQFRVGIPTRFLASLRLNPPNRLKINGYISDIQLISINPTVEPLTRTVEALFDIKQPESKGLYSGALASINLPQRHEISGFWVPNSALTEGIRGLWSIYSLQKQSDKLYRIHELNVVVLYQAGGKSFISGLSLKPYCIIKQGLHKYVPNQSVTLADESILSK